MIEFLIALIIIVAVVYCIRLLLPLLSLPEPINTVVLIIVGLVALLYLLSGAGVVTGPTLFPFRRL